MDAVADAVEPIAPPFEVEYGHFRFGPRGMEVGAGASFEAWQECGVWLRGVHRQIQMWLGDWINYGRAHYGELAEQGIATDFEQRAAEAMGWKPETIDQVARVARQVPAARRDPDLPFSHHREVADLPPADQTFWLARAKNENMSTERLRLALKAEKAPADTSCWLIVRCASDADREALRDRMAAEGREVKLT